MYKLLSFKQRYAIDYILIEKRLKKNILNKTFLNLIEPKNKSNKRTSISNRVV
jgi:hypothetical protein